MRTKILDFLQSRTFFQRDLCAFSTQLIQERGIGFTVEFETLPKIDNEPYCEIKTSDGLLRLELYVDSANIISFFDGKEQSICLECYEGHFSADVADEYKSALPLALKQYDGIPMAQVAETLSGKGIQSRWFRFFGERNR